MINLAVPIFFTLSGRVLAISILKHPGDMLKLVSSSIRRPFRLFIPVLAAHLFLWFILLIWPSDPGIPARVEQLSEGAIKAWEFEDLQVSFLGAFGLSIHVFLASKSSRPIGTTW